MERLKLRYKKGSKEAGESLGMGGNGRMWDIIEPIFPEYAHTMGRIPTFSRLSLLAFLKTKGYVNETR